MADKRYELVKDDTDQWVHVAKDYAVSRSGRVRRVSTGRILRPVADAWGYLRVNIYTGGICSTRSVHKMVCEAFNGPAPTPAHQVAHSDGNSLNNEATNLRWATARENAKDRSTHGRWQAAFGAQHGNAKLSEADVFTIICEPARKGVTLALAAKYRVSPSTISRIRRGERWLHLRAAEALKDYAPVDAPATEAA